MTSSSVEQRIIDDANALLPRLNSLQQRAREIMPPTPSATPTRVRQYEQVQDVLQSLANSLTEQPDASGAQGTNERPHRGIDADNLVLPITKEQAKKSKEQRAQERVTSILREINFPAIEPVELKSIITMESDETKSDQEDEGLKRLLRGYENIEPDEWRTLLSEHQVAYPRWHELLEKSQEIEEGDIVEERLLSRHTLINDYTESTNAAQYVHFVFSQLQAVQWAADWEQFTASGVKRQVTDFYEKAYLSKHERDTDYENMDATQQSNYFKKNRQFESFKKQCRRRQQSCKALFDMYKMFGCAVFLDRTWDAKHQVELRSPTYRLVYERLLKCLQDMNERNNENCLLAIQEDNEEVLLSVVEVLGGTQYGGAIREHVSDFLKRQVTNFSQ